MPAKPNYPLPMEVLTGQLPEKNVGLNEALKLLRIERSEYEPPETLIARVLTAGGESYYYTKFSQGSTMFPRNFWFVKPVRHGVFAIDPRNPHVVSDESNETKPPWDTVKLEGNISSEFLFATLLGEDIVPFGYLRARPVFLPIYLQKGKFTLITNSELVSTRGHEYRESAKYLAQAEETWARHATAKARKFSIYEWVNYRNKLVNQNPRAKLKVLYVASSTYLAACTVNQQGEFGVLINGTGIRLNTFVAESKTYYYETSSAEEANYLLAILNSSVVDDFIKPLQTRGLWGARDIHKRPLKLPIPKFDSADIAHARLADLAETCRKRVSAETNSLAKYGSIGRARSFVREMLKEELEEVNRLTLRILTTGKSGKLLDFIKEQSAENDTKEVGPVRDEKPLD